MFDAQKYISIIGEPATILSLLLPFFQGDKSKLVISMLDILKI